MNVLLIDGDASDRRRFFPSGIELLCASGIKAWQIQVYILCGFDSSFDEDIHRGCVTSLYISIRIREKKLTDEKTI